MQGTSERDGWPELGRAKGRARSPCRGPRRRVPLRQARHRLGRKRARSSCATQCVDAPVSPARVTPTLETLTVGPTARPVIEARGRNPLRRSRRRRRDGQVRRGKRSKAARRPNHRGRHARTHLTTRPNLACGSNPRGKDVTAWSWFRSLVPGHRPPPRHDSSIHPVGCPCLAADATAEAYGTVECIRQRATRVRRTTGDRPRLLRNRNVASSAHGSPHPMFPPLPNGKVTSFRSGSRTLVQVRKDAI